PVDVFLGSDRLTQPIERHGIGRGFADLSLDILLDELLECRIEPALSKVPGKPGQSVRRQIEPCRSRKPLDTIVVRQLRRPEIERIQMRSDAAEERLYLRVSFDIVPDLGEQKIGFHG